MALREDREALPTVVALVVDNSASQKLDGRDRTTNAAREALQKQLAQFHGLDVRTIEAGGGISTDGTNLFGPLANGLADVPPDRVARELVDFLQRRGFSGVDVQPTPVTIEDSFMAEMRTPDGLPGEAEQPR